MWRPGRGRIRLGEVTVRSAVPAAGVVATDLSPAGRGPVLAVGEPVVLPFATEPPPPNTPPEDRVRRSLGWSLLNSVSGRLLTVGVGMVLARLLTPAEYGNYAVALLVLTVTQSMNELGVSVALLRSTEDPTRLAPTAVTLSVGASTCLYLAIFAAAPSLARTLGAPAMVSVIRLVGVNLLLDAVSSVPNALLSHSFRQARRALVDLGAFLPGATVSVVLAAAGWGPSSLAWGSLAGNSTAVVLVYVLAPSRPRPGWDLEHAKQLLSTGLPLAATSLVYLSILNVDYVTVGRMLGTEALGFYVLAFNLSSWPSSLLSQSIRRVAIPGFAQMSHDAASLGRAFAKSLGMLAAVAVFASLLLSMLAEPLVTLFYGRTWLQAVDALRWLAVLGCLRVLLDLAYDVLVALGATRRLLGVQLLWIGVLIVALPIGAAVGGIVGVAIGHVLVAGVVTGTAYVLALRRAGVPVQPVLTALTGPLVAGAVTSAMLAFGLRLQWEPWAILPVLGLAATLVYAGVLALRRENRPVVGRIVARLRRRAPRLVK